MNADPFAELLTPAEVKSLTGEAKADGQDRQLTTDGIPFRRRGERILVSRFHTREWLAGKSVTPSRGFNMALVK
jgi:hypothetical protein